MFGKKKNKEKVIDAELGELEDIEEEDVEGEDLEGKETEEEPYEYTVICENCEEEVNCEIPYGTTVKEFLKDKICDECGCEATQPKEDGKKLY